MKFSVGVIAASLILVAGTGTYYGFSNSDTLPELPDPNFDYHNASLQGKTEWMTNLALHHIAMHEKLKSSGRMKGQSASYAISPSDRKLVVTLENENGIDQIYPELSSAQREDAKKEFEHVTHENCEKNVTKNWLVDDTKMEFIIKVNSLANNPIKILLSRETCKIYNLNKK